MKFYLIFFYEQNLLLHMIIAVTHREVLQKGKRVSTVDLLVLTRFDQLLFILKMLYTFYKTSCLNEEVNCTESSPSASIPCPDSLDRRVF